jgi:hypothetical protein
LQTSAASNNIDGGMARSPLQPNSHEHGTQVRCLAVGWKALSSGPVLAVFMNAGNTISVTNDR